VARQQAQVTALLPRRILHLSDYEDAKEAARQYAQARNSGARVRQYNEHNESARAGVRSALDWLDRKKKSAIRK
jgi:hypothetical protein